MEFNFKGKNILVTGGSRGIGRAISKKFAIESGNVIVCARRKEDLDRALKDLQNFDGKHSIVEIDLELEESPILLYNKIVKEYGNLDILIHNLGGSLQISSVFASYKEWEKVFRLNIGSSIELNNLFIPLMIKNGSGKIIHISSIAAETLDGNSPYAIAKSTLNAYIQLLGKKVAKDNIIVSGLMPGPVLVEGRYFSKLKNEDPKSFTEYIEKQVAINRISTPEEIANYVLFLASNYANFNPGAIWKIDGGTL